MHSLPRRKAILVQRQMLGHSHAWTTACQMSQQQIIVCQPQMIWSRCSSSSGSQGHMMQGEPVPEALRQVLPALFLHLLRCSGHWQQQSLWGLATPWGLRDPGAAPSHLALAPIRSEIPAAICIPQHVLGNQLMGLGVCLQRGHRPKYCGGFVKRAAQQEAEAVPTAGRWCWGRCSPYHAAVAEMKANKRCPPAIDAKAH